jgi:hypothetical protein
MQVQLVQILEKNWRLRMQEILFPDYKFKNVFLGGFIPRWQNP